MKRYLIVKMSSLGDVLHLLPSLTDVMMHRDDVQFDWVVEKNFTEIPTWHPLVDRVIPIQLRQWRKSPWQAIRSGAWRTFKQALQERHYDGVIDAQGLMKSSWIASLAHGKRIGLDKYSARESLASLLYQRRISVATGQHAITRLRELFAKIFDYPLPSERPQFGIAQSALSKVVLEPNYYLFLHGTTWDTKHWPVEYWIELAKLAGQARQRVYLPWGSLAEKARAEKIQAQAGSQVTVLPKLTLSEITYVLAQAKGVVAVDTGLGHIGAAVGVPILSLYGPTDPGLTGAFGPKSAHQAATLPCAPCFKRQCHIEKSGPQPPCFQAMPPATVWQRLQNMVVPDGQV